MKNEISNTIFYALIVIMLNVSCNCEIKSKAPDTGHMLKDTSGNTHLPLNDTALLLTTRHFAVYKNTELVLLMEGKPGVLLSTASPSVDEMQKHPFINAQAMDADYENELGEILHRSRSFDEFLHLLIENKYDMISYNQGVLSPILTGGFRISNSSRPVAAMWKQKGQFASLKKQPLPGYLVFDHVLLTVYDEAFVDELYAAVKSSHNFDDLLKTIQSDLRCESLEK